MPKLALFTILFSTTFQVFAQTVVPDDTIVLRSGNFALTKAEYEKLILGFGRASGATTSGASNQSVQSGQDVARLLALVSEAQRRDMDKTQEMQSIIRVRGYTLLANALLPELEKQIKLDEAGTRALWVSEKHNFMQVQARHILIRHQGVKVEKPGLKGLTRTEAQAKAAAVALHDKLIKGMDFATAAKSQSDDESTSNLGGTLPAFSRGMMTAEFEMASFSLPNGGISEPIKTTFGYHIIQVVDRSPMPFDKVRNALENIRARKLYEEIGTSKITLNDAYFK